MARFDSAIALASRLILKNGETSTLRRRVDAAAPDPSASFERGTQTETNFSTPAVWLRESRERVGGTLVQTGDQRVLVPAADLGTEPSQVTDSVVRASGEIWNVLEVEPLRPNGQDIIYSLLVRR